jgi:iron complex outermembrane receptor protein
VVQGDQAGIEAYIERNYISDETAIQNLRTAWRTYDNETDNYQQDHSQLLFGRDLTKDIQINLAGHYTKGRGYFEQFRPNDRFLLMAYLL